ncbi:hypothetical protein N0V90_007395 [Kalmusia sp. IMI 367209]|nr:hypothetical protein N0V90_007395 [Kalmusia sp. IMI 367209]
MSTEPPPSRGSSAWVPAVTGFFRANSKSLQPDQQPTDGPGHLSPPEPVRSRSNSTSRSIRSIRSIGLARARSWVQHLSGRSSLSSTGTTVDSTSKPLTEDSFKEAEGLFNALERYNEFITNEVSVDQNFSEKRLAGIQKILRKSHGCGVISDLPESLFDIALLWCPADDLTRKPADANEPSWSWRGWNGAINFPFDPLTCPDVRTDGAPKTFFVSLIRSFNLGPTAGNEVYTVRNRPEKLYRRRIEYPDGRWIPTGDQLPALESGTLRFTTKKLSAAAFQMEQLYYYEGQDEPLICTGLRDSQNRKCGAIMDYEKNIRAHDGELHLILLSISVRVKSSPRDFKINTAHPSGIPIWRNGGFLGEDEIGDADESYESGEFKMYNVMLIQEFNFEDQTLPNGQVKKQPIARRVAVGRIHEAAWNAANPETANIVLQ